MNRLISLALCVIVAAVFAAPSQAVIVQYEAFLDGPSEDIPNASPGTGYATADYDDVAHTLALSLTFNDLIGTTTVTHIHAPTVLAFTGPAGVATTTPTFAGFPVGVTSGVYAVTLDLTVAGSYNPAFITANGGTTAGAEVALAAALADGKAYWNVHTTIFPGGEIRGFFGLIPEPASLALLACGALMLARRR